MGGYGSNVESVIGVLSKRFLADRRNDGSEGGGWRLVIIPGGWCDGSCGVVVNQGIYPDTEGHHRGASGLVANQ